MVAHKCDRCGKYFGNYSAHVISLPEGKRGYRWEKIKLTCGGA